MRRHFALFTLASALLLTLFLTACPMEYERTSPLKGIPITVSPAADEDLYYGTSRATASSFGVSNKTAKVIFGDSSGTVSTKISTYTIDVVAAATAIGLDTSKILNVSVNFTVCDYNYWCQIEDINFVVNGDTYADIDVVSQALGNAQICGLKTAVVATQTFPFVYSASKSGKIVIDNSGSTIYGAVVAIDSINIYFDE